MADRFPSLEDFSEGTTHLHGDPLSILTLGSIGQTEVVDTTGATEDDFLARERAALGEDADQFTTTQDNAAGNAEDAGDDLLGGGGNDTPVPEIGAFESSFPSMDTQTQNEVRIVYGTASIGR